MMQREESTKNEKEYVWNYRAPPQKKHHKLLSKPKRFTSICNKLSFFICQKNSFPQRKLILLKIVIKLLFRFEKKNVFVSS